MKILYIAPEHVSGTLSLFKLEHERRGDECRFVTFWHSQWDFPDDICLNLGSMPNRSWVKALRNLVSHDPHQKPSRIENGRLPVWKPNPALRALFALRDEKNWRAISSAIDRYKLFDFDVLHLDGGADFTRDARFAREFKRRGKPIVSYYHGSDLRSRGFIPAVDVISDLRLTPEWDLAVLDKRLHYQYLPVDLRTVAFEPYSPSKPFRIGHAARNPLKGTSFVVEAVEEISKSHDIELVLINNMSYSDALRAKRSCSLFIDQLTNEGGWGYGMSGVEALAMGIPTITNLPEQMKPLIGEHPFIEASPESLYNVLLECIADPARMKCISETGRNWVNERHSILRVTDSLYDHYRRLNWLKS